MTADGFLTVISIFIAGYAILSSSSRLRIRLHQGYQLTTAVFFLLTIFYFVFFDTINLKCWLPYNSLCQIITIPSGSKVPGMIAFILTIIWVFIAYNIMRSNKISDVAIPVLEKLITELARQNKHSEIIDIIHPHISDIIKSSNKKFDLIFKILIKDDGAIKYFSQIRPDIAIELMHSDRYEISNFINIFLEDQISNKSSQIYIELKNNQNFSKGRYYHIPTENIILNQLVKKSDFAWKYSTYRPIGEYIINSLTPAQNENYISYLNLPLDNFDERDKWQDSTYTGLHYLNLIVTFGVENEIEWHMWLFYYQHIIESLVSIYDESGLHVNKTDEFPTKNSFIIYTIFSVVTDWISLAKDIENEKSPHSVILNINNSHQNNNIPKSACIALGKILSVVLRSAAINEKFKRYMFSIALNCIVDLSHQDNTRELRQVLILCILKKGYYILDRDYIETIHQYWYTADISLRMNTSDFKEQLETSLSGFE